MRKYTEDERKWLTKFNFGEKRRRDNTNGYKADLMNKGEQVTMNIEKPIDFNLVEQRPKSSEIDKYVKRYWGTMHGNSSDYTPRDYFTLPEQWFTHRWTDRVDDLIDRSRGKMDVTESDIPGIIMKNEIWYVNRHFEGETKLIGKYKNLHEAKYALKEYNKRVTKSGYGVEYE